MQKIKLMICNTILMLAAAGCASTPHARPPAPPAWLMQPPPDLLTPLNGIISPSESE
ncbi:hypothetical protein BVV00_12045 [Serratia sp. OMLW3]|nr:hypothetical protein BVV00_12045 [Serratia sp. OMLW3]PIJ20484.1 hypothetical protein BVU99_02495 [Serratia sp. OLAL2]